MHRGSQVLRRARIRRQARLPAASVAAGVVALLALACGSGRDSTGTPESSLTAAATTPASPTSPAPTASPAGTPRAGGYGLARTLEQANFDLMLGLVTIPGSDNEAVVVTQRGRMYRIALDGSSALVLFGDIAGRLTNARGTEEGLLGLAFSPQFPQDGLVYLYYTRGSPAPSILSRFRTEGGLLDEASEQVLLEMPQPFANHNGGQLTFGPDGYLYLGLGDGGSAGDPQGNGQNLGELLGSILRLDVSGGGVKAPPDNPFVGRQGARPEIYAYGLRNPWRFSFDRSTRELWAGDVGQNRWEEVDRIVAGGNYGWNIMEGRECFRAAACNQSGLQLPRAVYGREGGCSITGGYVYRGSSMPELQGWYVYGDFCSGMIRAVNTASESEPVLLGETGQRISSFGELPDGELLVITFNRAIYRLQRAG